MFMRRVASAESHNLSVALRGRRSAQHTPRRHKLVHDRELAERHRGYFADVGEYEPRVSLERANEILCVDCGQILFKENTRSILCSFQAMGCQVIAVRSDLKEGRRTHRREPWQ